MWIRFKACHPHLATFHDHNGDALGGYRQVDVGAGVLHVRLLTQQLRHFTLFGFLGSSFQAGRFANFADGFSGKYKGQRLPNVLRLYSC